MKLFKFSLESVLKLRVSRQEEALKVLGRAAIARQKALGELALAKAKWGALMAAIHTARGKTPQAFCQSAWFAELGRQEAVCKSCAENLQRAALEEKKAKEAYLARRNESEALHKLKSKRMLEHQKQLERLTEKELEEIMLSRRGTAL